MKWDNEDEDALLAVLQRFGLFSAILSQTLQNIANKDLVTQDIKKELMTIPQNGQSQLYAFVEERLLSSEGENSHFQGQIEKEQIFDFCFSV